MSLRAASYGCPRPACFQISVSNRFIDIYLDAAMFGVNSNRYCSFAYSALASFRMGMSASASFHSARKSL